MQFSILAIAVAALAAGQGAFAAVVEVRQNAGTPCTATVSGSKRDGVCNAAGQCSINVPPNENFRVRSDQCA